MKKADINFWTDVTIGLAFAASAVSGIVFLLPLSGDSLLGIGFDTWNTLHTWSSLTVVAGVIAHLALHWKWVTVMARKYLPGDQSPAPAGVQSAGGIGRRALLRYAVVGAALAGVAAVSLRLLEDDSGAAGPTLEETADPPWEAEAIYPAKGSRTGRAAVACRKGVVYCPYPGRCHSFRDRDGDGYCDLSIPT